LRLLRLGLLRLGLLRLLRLAALGRVSVDSFGAFAHSATR
jgi:hypothetical protein